jgi:hypothetical protein
MYDTATIAMNCYVTASRQWLVASNSFLLYYIRFQRPPQQSQPAALLNIAILGAAEVLSIKHPQVVVAFLAGAHIFQFCA